MTSLKKQLGLGNTKKKKLKDPSHSKDSEYQKIFENQFDDPIKRFIRPDNQLNLTERELEEDITRILTGDDPNLPQNICYFSFKEKCYKPIPPNQGDNMAIHFRLEGSYMNEDSQECIKYTEKKNRLKELEKITEMGAHDGDNGFAVKTGGNKTIDDENGGDNREHEINSKTTTLAASVVPSVGALVGGGGGAVGVDHRKNQFNYSNRASQTFINSLKSRGMYTIPPPITQYREEVTQWHIRDSYISECVISMVEHQKDNLVGDGEKRNFSFEDKLASIVLEKEESSFISSHSLQSPNYQKQGGKDEPPIHKDQMKSALKTIERIVGQNAQHEIFQDFKYWDDASDQYRRSEGSLLPLWRFSSDLTKNRKQVTALCWNTKYNDLFAVGYGSYNYSRQGSGMICCFSLKNTTHPEYMVTTESGVLDLDFHPRHPSLLAVGCYDGTVLVYDINTNKENNARNVENGDDTSSNNNSNEIPIYSSSSESGKHPEPIWQVHWDVDDIFAKELSFFSISGDGRVTRWTLSKNRLNMELVMYLRLERDPNIPCDDYADYLVSIGMSGGKSKKTNLSVGNDNLNMTGGLSMDSTISIYGLSGGCSFDFNKRLKNYYLVGTEEGNIHECSRAYSGRYIKTYQKHHMSVYTVKWNPFHEDIFASCSEDWTVKIFDHKNEDPILQFDLGTAVGDVCWSPHSSTVFAAVTISDGKVHVFDLSQNKRSPLCSQQVATNAQLTKVSFNTKDYILIVGDSRGSVISLKLSPNLRKLHVDSDANHSQEGGEKEEQTTKDRNITKGIGSMDEGDETKGDGDCALALDRGTIERNKMVEILASIDNKYSII